LHFSGSFSAAAGREPNDFGAFRPNSLGVGTSKNREIQKENGEFSLLWDAALTRKRNIATGGDHVHFSNRRLGIVANFIG
jgi:hypothetical protein